MIIKHQKLDFGDKTLVERITIKAPFRLFTNFVDEACFIYFIEGKAKINSAEEQQLVSTGESVLLKCGTYLADFLEYAETDSYEVFVLHFYPDVFREIYAHEVPSFSKPTADSKHINKIVSNDILKRFVESFQIYFDNTGIVNKELLKLKVKELVLLLIQSENAKSIQNLFSDLFTPRTLNLKQVVNNHLFSNLSINDLASLSQLSTSTFNRTFNNLYNDTPANYIKTKRLERAKELLAVSTLTISEIAFKACFNDMAHFSRSFKSAFKQTPSEYRTSLNNSKA